jgi:hypothetical protein
MTPQRLSRIGEALYGPSWRAALAAALKVNERTIRRWAADISEIPPGLGSDLAALCRTHADSLTKLAEQLEASTAPDAVRRW